MSGLTLGENRRKEQPSIHRLCAGPMSSHDGRNPRTNIIGVLSTTRALILCDGCRAQIKLSGVPVREDMRRG